jgi:hypothetical protein
MKRKKRVEKKREREKKNFDLFNACFGKKRRRRKKSKRYVDYVINSSVMK